MARSSNTKTRPPLLPEGAKNYLIKRLFELLGLCVFTLAAAYILMLASYDAQDPSYNSASTQPVRNLFGLPGAHIADLMLQSVGLSALLPGLTVALWSWHTIKRLEITFLWLRLMSLLCAILLLSLAAHQIQPGTSWPIHSGLGGVAGLITTQKLTALAGLLAPAHAQEILWGFAILCFIAGMGAQFYAFALTREQWRAIGQGVKSSLFGAILGLKRAAGSARQGLARSSQTDPFKSNVADDVPFDLPEDKDEDTSAPSLTAQDDKPSLLERTKKASKRIIAANQEETPSLRKTQPAKQQNLSLSADSYNFPPYELLTEASAKAKAAAKMDHAALENNAELLEQVLADFGVKGEIVEVRPGPVVTLYELEPAAGTKTSRVISLADDIARSMSAVSVRIAVVPGRSVIGIELPNAKRQTVYLRELLETNEFENGKNSLNMALGVDIGGEPVMADLARMPHLLVAGTTGSGKSVGINTMILSLLYRLTPDQCKFIMIDPKMLELSVYDGIPHLLSPVVTEPGKAIMALKWCVQEMNERYRLMSNLGVRNIAGYNAKLAEARKKGEELTRRVQTGFDPETGKPVFEEQPLDMNAMPYLVIIVDEFADLMLMVGKEIDACIQSLAQKARAAGIHLIMATQRPSVDVMTGTIKANFPSRISFTVTTKIDSRTILETQGAEQLLGMGDMLFKPGGGQVNRVHGPFVSDEEVEHVVTHLKKQGEPNYVDAVTEDSDEPIDGLVMPTGAVGGNTSSGDALYDQAVQICIQDGKASTSHIQRRLSIGYNRAARIVDQMEEDGIVSAPDRVGRRKVLAGKDGVD